MGLQMEKMLINAMQTEEVRVALIKDNHLFDLDIECPGESKKKGNIYKAVVTRREPSLDAIFVECLIRKAICIFVPSLRLKYSYQ